MPLRKLRADVFRANSMLVENGLVVLSWGNASGIDRQRGLVVIKPSGVEYQEMNPDDLVVVNMDGELVEGDMRPSRATATHLELYKAWPEIGGVVHTHSEYATAFAQAGMRIPCFGTTHADFCPGDVPCVRSLTREETETDYEANVGRVIVEHYSRQALLPLDYPGVVMDRHKPFAWGGGPVEAANNALIMESLAKIAMLTRTANPSLSSLPDYLVRKHYQRNHAPKAYQYS